VKVILFLCIANSARSQMAEGIARSLAPEGVKILSAGSHPTQVRPEAIAVLKEIGIDILECPVFLGNAKRLHWGLPDPVAARGTQVDRLNGFRHARDELRQRIAGFFQEELKTVI
jgi:protein-tyrosine-phosphatase